jgi:hypothetical protein
MFRAARMKFLRAAKGCNTKHRIKKELTLRRIINVFCRLKVDELRGD